MESNVQKILKPRGRPLSFDRDKALEDAMHVFWERGYEAASISELTTAMGITPPSLYAAFGDKEHLFLEAIERYASGPGSGAPRALAEEPTARHALQRMLEEAAEELTRPCHPAGCMVVTAATNCSVASAHIQAALAKRRAAAPPNRGGGVPPPPAAADEGIRTRIEQGVRDGELPADTDAASLANFYSTVLQGMSLQARDGASHDSLLATANTAMRAWPAHELKKKPATAKSRST